MSTQTVILPKTEYENLKRQAEAYRKIAADFFGAVARNPIDEIVSDFKKTDLYSDEFLHDLEDGLNKSSYLKNYEDKTAKTRP